jgi:hypothetical protein
MTNLYRTDLLSAPAPNHRIFIVSGEGDGGTYHRELYTGKRTQRAIKARLTRERCGGDRWACAEMCMDWDNEAGPVVLNMETGEYGN